MRRLLLALMGILFGLGLAVAGQTAASADNPRPMPQASTPVSTGVIAGTVTGNGGAGVQSASVYVYTPDGSYAGYASTDAGGKYTVTVPVGSYKVCYSASGYLDECYNDKSWSTADTVSVTAGATVKADAHLVKPGAIAGKVSGSDGTGLSYALVSLYKSTDQYAYTSTYTDADGNYGFSTVAPGAYKLRFQPPSGTPWLSEFYSDKATLDKADLVTVSTGTQTVNATLAKGAQITGTILDDDGTAIKTMPYASIYLADANRTYVENVTFASGRYASSGLAPGDYLISFGALDYISEYWEDASDASKATPVKVTSTDVIINPKLTKAAKITGKVTGPDGKPVADVDLWAKGPSGSWGARTDANGQYTVSYLPIGTYKVRFEAKGNLAGQWYKNSTTEAGATSFPVTAGATVSGIDAQLIEAGSISGTVTGSDGKAISGVYVYAQGTGDLSYWGSFTTGADGKYSFNGLSDGSYKLSFNPPAGTPWLSEYYNDKQDYSSADAVTIQNASKRTGIDAVLTKGALLSGTVTSETGPLSSAGVSVQSTSGGPSGFYKTVWSDSKGAWSLAVPTGTYMVRYYADSYVGEYWDNVYDSNAATQITVTNGDTKANLNAQLEKGSSISGTVTVSKGSMPYGWVNAYRDGDTMNSTSASFSSDGKYKLSGLRAGTYTLQFSASGYMSEWWDDKDDQGSATKITVGKGVDLTGKDAVLSPGAVITGKVVDGKGTAVPDAFVRVYDKDNQYSYVGYATAADGTFSVSNLRAGTYRVHVGPNWRSEDAFIAEWYKDKTSFEDATDVTLTRGQEVALDTIKVTRTSSITGVVKDTDSKPVQGVTVWAVNDMDEWSGTTDAAGKFTVTGLAAGDYYLNLRAPSGAQVAHQYHDGVPTVYGAKKVTVGVEQAVTVNPVMKKGGSISGTVKTATGVAQSNVLVQAKARGIRYETYSGADGKYLLPGLTPGTYTVSFTGSPDYWKQWYNGVPTSQMADPVTIDFGSAITGIDATLTDASYITGVITDPAKKPVSGVKVWVYKANSERRVATAITDANGVYRTGSLKPGAYAVQALGSSAPSLAPLWFPSAEDRRDAADVVVAAGKPTVASMQLSAAGAVTGKVTDATGSPLMSALVTLRSVTPSVDIQALTAADGTYVIGGVPAGKYTVYALPSWRNMNLIGRYYSNKYTPASADPVTVAKGATVPNINFALTPGASIAGKVTTSDGKQASGYVTALIKDADGKYVYSTEASIGPDGNYRIMRLTPGTYKLGVRTTMYKDQYWNSKATLADATPIEVSAEAAVTGKDFSLVIAPAIKGKVVTSDGKALPSYTWVAAYKDEGDGEWEQWESASVAADGTYTLAVPAGTYKLHVYTYNDGYGSSYWKNKLSLNDADPVTMAAADVTGVDFTLPKSTSVTGSVVLPAGYTGSVGVSLQDLSGDTLDSDWVTSSYPQFSFSRVAPGDYLLYFTGNGVLPEYWQDKPTKETATRITVTAGKDVTGLIATLDKGASISGTVSDSKSAPVGASVTVFKAENGEAVRYAETSPDGRYTITGLTAGQYLVEFDPYDAKYATQWFDAAAKRSGAKPITLAGSGTATANATVVAGGTLTGTVKDQRGVVLPGASVTAESADHGAWTVLSNAKGVYTFTGMDADDYTVHFKPSTDRLDLLSEWYNDAATSQTAKPVAVALGKTATADAQLAQGATVSGVVTGPDSKPVKGVGIDLFDKDGQKSLTAWTDATGTYRTTGLLPGSYKVRFKPGYYGGKGLVEQWWEKQPTQALSGAVTVTAGQQKTAVNAKLASVGSAVAPDAPTAVTATAGDAKVTVKWQAPAKNGGLPITKYEVVGKPWGECTTYGDLQCTISVDNDETYTFTVRASTDAGISAFSASSAPVTPLSGKPKAPTSVTATAGVNSATVRWTPGAGAPATGYTVTSWPDEKTCTTSGTSCVVSGLTADKVYTFTVVAKNALGESPASAASNRVTPTSAPSGGGGGGGGPVVPPPPPPPPPPVDPGGSPTEPPVTGGGSAGGPGAGGGTTPPPVPPAMAAGAKAKVKGKKVAVTWQPVPGATSYQVRVVKGKKASGWKSVSQPGFRTSQKKGTYFIEIRAIGPGGQGPVKKLKFKIK